MDSAKPVTTSSSCFHLPPAVARTLSVIIKVTAIATIAFAIYVKSIEIAAASILALGIATWLKTYDVPANQKPFPEKKPPDRPPAPPPTSTTPQKTPSRLRPPYAEVGVQTSPAQMRDAQLSHLISSVEKLRKTLPSPLKPVAEKEESESLRGTPSRRRAATPPPGFVPPPPPIDLSKVATTTPYRVSIQTPVPNNALPLPPKTFSLEDIRAKQEEMRKAREEREQSGAPAAAPKSKKPAGMGFDPSEIIKQRAAIQAKKREEQSGTKTPPPTKAPSALEEHMAKFKRVHSPPNITSSQNREKDEEPHTPDASEELHDESFVTPARPRRDSEELSSAENSDDERTPTAPVIKACQQARLTARLVYQQILPKDTPLRLGAAPQALHDRRRALESASPSRTLSTDELQLVQKAYDDELRRLQEENAVQEESTSQDPHSEEVRQRVMRQVKKSMSNLGLDFPERRGHRHAPSVSLRTPLNHVEKPEPPPPLVRTEEEAQSPKSERSHDSDWD